MDDNTTLIEFPCDFTIKIIGIRSENFMADVTAIILKHFPDTLASDINERRSQKESYCAISAVVKAIDQASLDALYQDLTKCPGIKMVL